MDQINAKDQHHSCQNRERARLVPLTSTRTLVMGIPPKWGKGLNTRQAKQKDVYCRPHKYKNLLHILFFTYISKVAQ